MFKRSRSLAHLAIQNHLKTLLSGSELEKEFSQINRIADVVWEERKIIFEIQVSPITLQEAQNRCHDYESLGYSLIWILHDKKFNKRLPGQAELFLRAKTSYFASGTFIYDQQEVIQEGVRAFRGPKLAVDLFNLSKPAALAPLLKVPTSIFLLRRLKGWQRELFYWLLETLSYR